METNETTENRDAATSTETKETATSTEKKEKLIVKLSYTDSGVQQQQSDPICRICFRGCSSADLLSPCFCKGTIAYVHRSCLEDWLVFKDTDSCDVCHFEYIVRKTPRSWREWFRDPGAKAQRSALLFYSLWAVISTPVMVLLVKNCADRCREYATKYGNPLGIVAFASLATFFATVHAIYLLILVRLIYKEIERWKKMNVSISLEVCSPQNTDNFGSQALNPEEATNSSDTIKSLRPSSSCETTPLLPSTSSSTASCSKSKSYSSIIKI